VKVENLMLGGEGIVQYFSRILEFLDFLIMGGEGIVQ
jgi:hypothetical protein